MKKEFGKIKDRIEKDIPIPGVRKDLSELRELLNVMEIGDSVLIKEDEVSSMKVVIVNIHRNGSGKRFTVKSFKDNTKRFWRIK